IMRLRIRHCAFDFGFEFQTNAKLTRALLQQDQKLLATDPAESMPGRYDPLPAIMHGDIVPICKATADGLRTDGIILRQVVQCLVGKNNAPTERIVRTIALEHSDLVRRVAQLHADREIETCGSAAEACDLQATPPF